MLHHTRHLPASFRSKQLLLIWPFCIAILGIACVVWSTHGVTSAASHSLHTTSARNSSDASSRVYVADSALDYDPVAQIDIAPVGPAMEGRATHKIPSAKALADACYARIESNPTITYTTVQSAVNASTYPTDVVKIAGTCTGVETQGGFTQTVYISKSITLRGGYTITNWMVSDPQANPTTLDAQNSGRVVYLDSGDVVLENLRITGGNEDTGGGIYNDNAVLTLSNTTVTSNSAQFGGGVYIKSGNATLRGGQINSNSAITDGGGVYVWSSGATFTQTGISSIAHNTADFGGGVYIWDGNTTLNEGQVLGNFAAMWGGGVFVQNGSATLRGGQIISNSAIWDGGGVYVRDSSASFQQTGVSAIAHNTATHGGGMFVWNGYTTLSEGQINDNSASQGGGVYVDYGQATLNAGQIVSNTAVQGGGVWIDKDTAIFTQAGAATIAHNFATEQGGGIYVYRGHAALNEGQITNNSASHGSGVYIYQGNATLDGGEIVSNAATFNGGGVYVDQGSATLSEGQIISNTAGQDGGGVYIAASGGAFTQTGVSTIAHNIANFGGGVYIVTGSAMLSSGQVINNSAETNGGGVFVWEGNAELNGGQIIDNSADAYGGGVYVNYGSATLSGGQIVNNTANNGGGIYVWDGSTTLSGGDILDNSASHDGGGVYVYWNNAVLSMSEGRISDNVARDGGGVYIYQGSATLEGGQIISNTAAITGYGGGMYVWGNGALLDMSGGQIVSNTANNGGGTYIFQGNATLSGGRIIGNSANNYGGGVYVDHISATVTLTNISAIARNSANYGGGIYVQDSPIVIQGSIISANHTITSGGGIYLTGDTTAQVLGNQILSNTASSAGGGVYVVGNAAPTLYSNQISDNTAAKSGGGIYVSGSGVLSPTIINNTIVGNMSNSTVGGGGGIYVTGRPALIQNNVISDNHAAVNNGGGIYLTGDTTARVLDNRILVNTADDYGGGVLIRSTGVYLANNIVADNYADDGGSGIAIIDSSPRLLHTTIARNSGASGVYATNTQTDSITVWLTNTILVSHTVGVCVTADNTATLTATLWGTDTWANETDWGCGGTIITGSINIWGDPDFVAPNVSNYHIGIYSAAKDEGVPTSVTTDIDGDPRPIGSGPDLGADEFPAALVVSKRATPDPVQTGGWLTYTIHVTNTGNVTLTATITDFLPTQVTPGGIRTWTTTITAPGGVWTETFVVTVETDYIGLLDNVVQVTSAEGATGIYTATSVAHTCWARLNDDPTDYHTVQAAVDAAGDGDIAKVAGTCAGVKPRSGVTQTVYISKSITLRGGYTTTNWSTSYPITQPTTLNALGQGRVIYITGDISPTIEGLRITGGDANGLGGDPQGGDAGGGVYLYQSATTLSSNAIFSNIAKSKGGGLFLYRSAATLISNTVFTNSTTRYGGGGMYLYESNTTLINNTVFNNVAKENGGGLILYHSAATLISNNVLTNVAGSNGGGLHIPGSPATLISNTIFANTANSSGGGLNLAGSDAILSNNTISSNTATLGYGGGLALWSSYARLSNNTISANSSRYRGGGLHIEAGSNAMLTNTVISDNQIGDNGSYVGSGLYIEQSSPRLLHTTIARNYGGDGSGVYVTNGGSGYSTVWLTNTILVGHTVGVTVTAGNTVTLEATLWGNDTDWGGAGTVITGSINIWDNPDFVEPNAGNYHLGIYSAAINEGVTTSVTTDIDGDPRSIGIAPDLGADECRAAVSASKHATPDPVQAGEQLTYTIRVTNTGGVDLHTTITDTFPAHIIQGKTSGWTLIFPGSVLTWTPTIAAPGGVWTETFVVTVEEDYVGPLINVVQITTDEGAMGTYTETTLVHDCYAQIASNPTITYTAVQAAVDAANDGDTVKVTGYCIGAEPRAGVTQTVYISKPIILRGGYTTDNWMMSDPMANPTTLNALEQGRVLYVTGDVSVTVEGLHITGGDAVGLGGIPSGDCGGGVLAVGSNATTTINDNQVIGNTAKFGGGMCFYHAENVMLMNNVISSNLGSIHGGGLHFRETLSVTLVSNTISDNSGPSYYGGARFVDSDSVTLIGNVVSRNFAVVDCGGLCFHNCDDVALESNIVIGNKAGIRGGGFFFYNSDVELINNVVADNRADVGGGFYIERSPVRLLHTTIARNSADGGAGVHVVGDPYHSTVALINTILVSHTVGVTVTAGNTVTLEATLWGTGTWPNDADWGGAGTVTSTVNLWGDPAFVNPDAGDYHIGAGSAAINTGVNVGVTTDIDGDPRPAAGGGFDVGADEAIWYIYLPLVTRDWPPIPEVPVLDLIENPDIDGSYNISWGTADLADYYDLEEATNGQFTGTTIVYTTTDTYYSISDKDARAYYYHVRACNSWGCSNWSNVEQARPWYEQEPNDLCPQEANGPLISGKEYYGYHNDDSVQQRDYFKFYASAGGHITIDLTDHTGNNNDVQLQLRDQNCERIAYDWQSPYRIEYTGTAAQWYYILVSKESSWGSSDTHYTLRATFPTAALRTYHNRYVTATHSSAD